MIIDIKQMDSNDLKDEIEKTLNDYDLSLGNVIQRPIDGLLKYHKSLLV